MERRVLFSESLVFILEGTYRHGSIISAGIENVPLNIRSMLQWIKLFIYQRKATLAEITSNKFFFSKSIAYQCSEIISLLGLLASCFYVFYYGRDFESVVSAYLFFL